MSNFSSAEVDGLNSQTSFIYKFGKTPHGFHQGFSEVITEYSSGGIPLAICRESLEGIHEKYHETMIGGNFKELGHSCEAFMKESMEQLLNEFLEQFIKKIPKNTPVDIPGRTVAGIKEETPREISGRLLKGVLEFLEDSLKSCFSSPLQGKKVI